MPTPEAMQQNDHFRVMLRKTSEGQWSLAHDLLSGQERNRLSNRLKNSIFAYAAIRKGTVEFRMIRLRSCQDHGIQPADVPESYLFNPDQTEDK